MPCRRPWNNRGLVSCGSGGGDYYPLLPEERERERGQARAEGGHGEGGSTPCRRPLYGRGIVGGSGGGDSFQPPPSAGRA